MLAISPALLYYSRYIRDEVMLCTLLVLLALCMFRYMESRSTGWLIATAVTLAFAFLTMEASFIFGGVFGGFLVLALAVQLWVINWPAGGSGGAIRTGAPRTGSCSSWRSSHWLPGCSATSSKPGRSMWSCWASERPSP